MKKVILILVPLIVAAGAVVGLALTGKVKIPGLTPKRFMQAKVEAKKDGTSLEKPKPKPSLAEPKAAPAPKGGDKALAKVWNGLPPKKLALIAGAWPPKDLVPILMKMEPEKVVKLLGELKPEVASSISREIQRQSNGT